MEHAPEITLKYSISRRELAIWYWGMWKRRLWRFHTLCLAISVSVVVLADGYWPPSAWDITRGLVAGAAVVLFLIFLPQIMFKAQTRTLIFHRNGIRTNIAKKSGRISWKDIDSISDSEGTIVVSRKNLNALLIPRRAFQSEQERESVLNTIQTWMGMTGKS